MAVLRSTLAIAALTGSAAALLSNSSLNSQVRCAFYGDEGLTISWNTLSQLSNPTVKYGLSPTAMTMTASSSNSTTYQSSVTWDNHVTITGLTPDTMYYYAPTGMFSNEAAPPPYQCKTSRPAGNMEPYSVAFIADMGAFGPYGLSTTGGDDVKPEDLLKPGEHTTIRSLRDTMDSYDFIIHGGDFAYADDWLKEERGGYLANTSYADGYKVYNSILNSFYDEVMNISAYKAYMTCVGNHEASCDDGKSPGVGICVPGQRNFTGYRNHFRMPSDVSGGFESFWYSFDYGSVHYIMFSTETNLGNGLIGPDEAPNGNMAGPFGAMNDQIDFINADLSSVDRCKTPWVVAIGHRPWFAAGDVCTNCSLAFAPVFEQYGVDLVLQGHYHIYERNLPVFVNGTIDPAGYDNPSSPVYIINGIAGHYDGMSAFHDAVPYMAYGLDDKNGTYGWSRVQFMNETHLLHEFVASNNDSVLDSQYLYKERKSCGASSTSSSTASVTSASTTTATSSAASSQTKEMTTSTVRTTEIFTVTSCPATVTNCPARSMLTTVVTSTRDLYTTVCPVTATEQTSSSATSASQTTQMTAAEKSSSSAVTAGSSKSSTTKSTVTTSAEVTIGTAGATHSSTVATGSKPSTIVTAGGHAVSVSLASLFIAAAIAAFQ